MEQHTAEDILRENEKIYRLMAENATDMIARLTVDGIYLYSSPACFKLMGYTQEELVGQSAYSFFHPDDLAAMHASYAPLLDGLDSAPSAYRVGRNDGTYVWVESISRAVYDLDTGLMLEIHVTTRDITERKLAQEALLASEERFRSAFDNSAIGMALVTPDGRWFQVNPSLCAIVGYSETELLAMSFQDITHPEDLNEDLELLDQLLAGTIPSYQLEKRYFHRLGHVVWVHISISLVRDARGRPLYCISQIQDVTERKRAEEEVRQLNAELALRVAELQQATRELAVLSDMSDRVQACTSEQEAYSAIATALTTLFPGDSGTLAMLDATKSSLQHVATWGSDPGQWDFPTDMCQPIDWKQLLTDAEYSGTIAQQRSVRESRNDLCIPLIAHGELLGGLHLRQAEPGQFPPAKLRLFKSVAEDIELLVSNLRLREILRIQSTRDPLTGLFNRRYMEESLRQELSRSVRSNQPIGVIMLDIDHFKQFNDRFGHAAGDLLLLNIGACLQNHIRNEDIACRYGGEEFIIIMAGASLEITMQRAEKIRAAISELRIQYLHQPLGPITSSFGIAGFPAHGSEATTLIAAADVALYQAKRKGRNRVVKAAKPSSTPTLVSPICLTTQPVESEIVKQR